MKMCICSFLDVTVNITENKARDNYFSCNISSRNKSEWHYTLIASADTKTSDNPISETILISHQVQHNPKTKAITNNSSGIQKLNIAPAFELP